MSHSKLDEGFCDKFDSIAARVGLKVFRSEYEELKYPAWKTIKEQMNASCAMFLLVGRELTKAQERSEKYPEWAKVWKFTQNWISYEIGLACQQGIDVWVFCDNVRINFPVPYLNNYALYGLPLKNAKHRNWMKWFFEAYQKGRSFPVGGYEKYSFKCPFERCGSIYNLYSPIPRNSKMICPTCLNEISFPEGWPQK